MQPRGRRPPHDRLALIPMEPSALNGNRLAVRSDNTCYVALGLQGRLQGYPALLGRVRGGLGKREGASVFGGSWGPEVC